ncbi:MAG: choice-of-anchor J domain-containing protein [Candidatus Cloacimonadaceae bacterium]|nr:choice-of-anchor J domain-containing protein [Candidatus Cloacimonadaceae bacterium]
MKTNVYKLMLLLVFSVVAFGAWAVVSDYAFTGTAGTYTEITGGTVLGTTPELDNESFNAIPLGFTFTYDGIAYTEVSIQANGFLAMGSTVASSYLAISGATATNNVIVALNRDIKGRTDGQLSYLLTGTAPSRVFTVQWKNYRRVPTTAVNDIFNFQIKLHEGSNQVKFVYGPFTAVTVSTAATVQVGIRGDSIADFNNRATTTDWSATTAGTAANSNCTLSATVFPASGLTFAFAPSQQGEPPLPAQNPVPANSAINVSLGVNLSWLTGGGTPTGYKVFLGTNNPPTNMVNGSIQTGYVYDHPTDLIYSTVYYWKIVPFNEFGDALNCPLWQFTTLADPTITTYPYVQNFDTVTPPGLPVGWSTINANADIYTWETFAGTAHSAPNCARIRYNTTVAMNDWLVAPPLQVNGEYFYRLSFFYRANSATYPEKLSVFWGTSPTAAAMTNQLFTNQNITNITYVEAVGLIDPPQSGTIYIGFHGHSAMDMFYLHLDNVTITEVVEIINPPTGLTATLQNINNVHLSWVAPVTSAPPGLSDGSETRDPSRALLGYKVYRDGALIHTITNPATVAYIDPSLAVGTYSYTVTAVFTTGESVPAGPVSVTINPPLLPPVNLTATVLNNNNVRLAWEAPGTPPPPPPGFSDGFESYPNFALTFAPWVLVDVDLSTTYGMEATTWPNENAAMAYMIFNPSATTPPMTTLTPNSGSKMAASFASTTPINNDWMISPPIPIASAATTLNFWARSYTAQYGLERFKIGISAGGTAPANFTIISGASYIQAPITWTNYSYSLAAYNGQTIRFAIQCVSDDAFIFFVDDVSVGVPTGRESVPLIASSTIDLEARAIRSVGTPVLAPAETEEPTRQLTGYKVYRNGLLINTITNPATLIYDDLGLAVGTYNYTVTAVYTYGESVPAGPVSVTITPALLPPLNLSAAVDGNDVTLDWDSPVTPPTGSWITWCNDVLGNSVGTNAVALFDVAHRFDQTDLAPHAGGTVTRIKFVPAFLNCAYTVKVWTGGNATNAGTLVSSQLVSPFIEDEWNTVVLNTPILIPTTGDLYVGFEANTQGGYPAGCDAGPQIQGKGNMIYWSNAWTTLTALAPSLTYNWLIQAFVAQGTAMKAIEPTPIAENRSRYINNAALALQTKNLMRNERNVIGFNIYRGGTLIHTINDPAITAYTDMDLANGTYNYGVTTTYTHGESVPATVQAVVNVQLATTIFEDGFETYPNFANLFAPWTLLDIDQSPTYGFTGIEFPGSGAQMAYIVFNPSATTPPITTLIPHGGAKMAASFAATVPPNNDWMIATRAHLGTNSAIRFYARSHASTWGLERFRIGISTQPNIIVQSFQYITGTTYVEAPVNWTEYVYDLSAYDGQSVWIAIRCVSNDAFVFYVDNFTIHSVGGWVSNDDNMAPAISTSLIGNYPNPFNPETTIRFSIKDAAPVTIQIYNVKGQLVKTLVNEIKDSGNHNVIWKGLDNNNRPVSSGVYFYKMNTGKYSSTKKMILMK